MSDTPEVNTLRELRMGPASFLADGVSVPYIFLELIVEAQSERGVITSAVPLPRVYLTPREVHQAAAALLDALQRYYPQEAARLIRGNAPPA